MTAPKTPRRLFAPELPALGDELLLPADSVHHARVLRLETGAQVELFDGRAGFASATLIEVSRDRIRCRVDGRREVEPPTPAVHVVLGLPKGNKLEGIARMVTELGVFAVHLAQCERSVPRPSGEASRLSRLERIALEACAQSGQAHAPHFHGPAPLRDIADRAAAGATKLVFWERATQGLAHARFDARASEVWLVVGPEGGLSDNEVQGLRQCGFCEVGLGPALLRVETAAPVIAALVLHRLGRLGGEQLM